MGQFLEVGGLIGVQDAVVVAHGKANKASLLSGTGILDRMVDTHQMVMFRM